MRGRRRRGVVMFWGEEGGRWEGGMERMGVKEKDEEERSYRRLVFFCCYEFGRVFFGRRG